MKKSIKLLSIIIGGLVFFTACKGGGSSSGSSSSASQDQVRGVVSDPEISGALVTFERNNRRIYFYNSANILTYYATTDERGKFSVRFKAGENLTGVTMIAKGGVDTGTGDNLDGIELSSPLEAFNSKAETVISPLTSLLVEEINNSGSSLADARRVLKEKLGLRAGDNITLNPAVAGNERLLGRSFIITRIIKQLKNDSSASEPFKKLATSLGSESLLDESGGEKKLNESLLTDLSIEQEDRSNLIKTYSVVEKAGGNRQNMLNEIANNDLAKSIRDAYVRDINPTEPISSDRITIFEELAKTTRSKLERDIPESHRNDIVRLLVNKFDLTTDAAYLNDLVNKAKKASFTDLNSRLNQFARQDKVNSHRYITKYTVDIPLTKGELLGNDKLKRIDYYYNSNISNFYSAEYILKDVRDDQLNDDIYSVIVAGKSKNGLFSDAEMIIKDKIWTTQGKSDSRRYMADSYLLFDKKAEAKIELDKSWQGYKRIIETAGKENFSNESSANLQNLTLSYNRAGDNDGTQKVLDYSMSIFPALGDDLLKLGRLASMFSGYSDNPNAGLAGTWLLQAEKERAAGNNAKANELTNKAEKYIDQSQEITKNMPANNNSGIEYYDTRLRQLASNMLFYAQAGKKDKVAKNYNNDSGNDFVSLINFGATRLYSSQQFPAGFKALAKVGMITEAKNLITKLKTTGNVFTRLDDPAPLYMEIAAELALDSSGDAAWDLLNNEIDSTSDRIKNLTFKGLGTEVKSKYFLAQLVFSSLSKAEKLAHLQKGEKLLDDYQKTISNNYDYFTVLNNHGYPNLAHLYYQLGEKGRAENVIEKMVNIVENKVTSRFYKYEILKRLAQVSSLAKDQAKTDELVEKAYNLISTGNDYSDRASNYYLLVTDTSATKDLALRIIADLKDVADKIYTKDTSEKEQEDAKETEARAFTNAAELYNKYAEYTKAKEVLEKAYTTALKIYTPKTKYRFVTKSNPAGKIPKIIKQFALAKDHERAKAIAEAIPTSQERNYSLHMISTTYCDLDLFPNTTVASIDSDRDGKPDFFNSLATAQEIAASGLELDNDIDGDGVEDTLDKYPYYNSKS